MRSLWLFALAAACAPRTLPPPAGARLVVANVEGGRPERAALAGQALAALGADVVVLVEWDGTNVDLSPLAAEGLRALVRAPARGAYGLAVLARGGDGAGVPSPAGGPCPLPWASARIALGEPALDVGLLAVHLPPPVPACAGGRQEAREALGALVEGGRAAVAIGAVPEGLPTVVAGDLNLRGRSRGLRRLREATGLRDAARDAHAARSTFPMEPVALPLFRIDHVLLPGGLAAAGSFTVPIPGSDHRAVVVDLVSGP